METKTTESGIDLQKPSTPLRKSGLGGWLILVQIGLIATLVLLLVQIVNFTVPSFSPDIWSRLTSEQSELYHPLWGPVLIFEAVYNSLFIVFSFWCLIAMYRKQARFPKLMMIFYGVSLLASIADYGLMAQILRTLDLEDANSLKDTVRAALTCAIWIPYLLKSERVKNTFVR